MDIEKMIERFRTAADKWEAGHQIILTGELRVQDALRDAATALSALFARAEAAEARAEKAEKMASELLEGFTDFVTGGTHNAATYCANRRSECVDGRGWCNVDMKTCRGFYPEAAKKED